MIVRRDASAAPAHEGSGLTAPLASDAGRGKAPGNGNGCKEPPPGTPAIPDPEVSALPKRRRFTADYKARIVEEADGCTEDGAIGALLRREGLYSSQFSGWKELYRTQRAAEAARNTGQLISGSVKNAESGVAISREVADSLENIAEGARKVNQIAAEVAAGGDEQSKGIDQVNTAVAQMNQVTQQNAANSEEGAAAAEELSAQAEEMMIVVESLGALVGRKATGGSHRSAPAPARRAGQSHAPHMKSAERRQYAKALPAARGGNGKSARSVVKPEDVIPLDDEELAEF